MGNKQYGQYQLKFNNQLESSASKFQQVVQEGFLKNEWQNSHLIVDLTTPRVLAKTQQTSSLPTNHQNTSWSINQLGLPQPTVQLNGNSSIQQQILADKSNQDMLNRFNESSLINNNDSNNEDASHQTQFFERSAPYYESDLKSEEQRKALWSIIQQRRVSPNHSEEEDDVEGDDDNDYDNDADADLSGEEQRRSSSADDQEEEKDDQQQRQQPSSTTSNHQSQQPSSTTSNQQPQQQQPQSVRVQKKKLAKQRRLYKCRHCSFETDKKVENWQHIRIHMRPEKLLACESCQFVTEYKHHLEYHQRNHSGYKPFKCDNCDYQCVNKSMLNSHMKSHSSVYQYQCGDCKYATKYVHSLKMHLRKYNHQPAQPMIDVYGRKRGPKSTSSSSSSTQEQQCILDLRVDSKLMQ